MNDNSAKSKSERQTFTFSSIIGFGDWIVFILKPNTLLAAFFRAMIGFVEFKIEINLFISFE